MWLSLFQTIEQFFTNAVFLKNVAEMQGCSSIGNLFLSKVDAHGRYIYVSPERLKRTQHQLDELLGKYVRDYYPNTLVDEVIRTRRPVTLRPMITKTPKGDLQSFVSYYPLVDGDECLGCFLYASFGGINSAVEFTHVVTEISRNLVQAKRELSSFQKRAANYTTTDIIGQSQAVNHLKQEIFMVARTSSNVLIQGETGTGKELVAHSIHSLSRRCDAPFLRVNCSAIPENLMEVECPIRARHSGCRLSSADYADGTRLARKYP